MERKVNKDIGFIWVNRTEGVVCHFRELRFRQRVEEGRLPDIRQSDDSHGSEHPPKDVLH